MAGKRLRLRVCTPRKTVLEREADFVLLRTRDGDLGMLHGHQPCVLALDYGMLRAYMDKEETDALLVMGGFATVGKDEVTVLTALAEPPDRLDEVIQELEREREESARREQSADLEMHRVERALRKNLVRNDGSTYAIIKGQEERED